MYEYALEIIVIPETLLIVFRDHLGGGRSSWCRLAASLGGILIDPCLPLGPKPELFCILFNSMKESNRFLSSSSQELYRLAGRSSVLISKSIAQSSEVLPDKQK